MFKPKKNRVLSSSVRKETAYEKIFIRTVTKVPTSGIIFLTFKIAGLRF